MSKPSRADHFADPVFALNADAVARALMISTTTLDTLVEKGTIPKPFPIPGHPRLLRWDAEDVKNLVREWKELANPGSNGDFGEVR